MDNNFFIEDKKAFILSIDVLECTSYFVYHIMTALLGTLLEILKNNKTI